MNSQLRTLFVSVSILVVAGCASVTASDVAKPPMSYAEVHGDVGLHQKFFVSTTDGVVTGGKNFSVKFVIDRPAKDVWAILKDFNLWQNPYGYYYSGVIGDEEGNLVRLGNEPGAPKGGPLKVLRVIPEHLIVLDWVPREYNGSTSGGYNVFSLHEHDGKTLVTVLMNKNTRSSTMTEDEVLAGPRALAEKSTVFWRDSFIPTLKKLVESEK